MEVVYQRCCGIDVHKKMIVACFRDGRKKEIREFGTLTSELRELTSWLLDSGCEMIAMESTASYWKPLYNLFELSGLPAMVVNAHHMKSLPGRKTDMKDAEWIADLLQHGLLKASFIPDREQRELREVARYRKSLVEERSRELNRLQKMLEGANIKLGSKLTHINGKSGRKYLDLLLSGEEISLDAVDDIRNHQMHSSAEEILTSLDGIISPLQRKLIRSVLDHIDDMTKRIKDIDKIIKDYIKDYEDAINALEEIPGVGKIGAQTIISEIGKDMSRFPSASHLCSWAGVAPGNNESAGKRRSGRTTKGNPTLKTTLIQCAHGTSKHKDTFFYAQFQRIKIRRGSKIAAMAVAHSMLTAIYYILKYNQSFHDLGADYYNKFNREKKINSYLKKLNELGYDMTAVPAIP